MDVGVRELAAHGVVDAPELLAAGVTICAPPPGMTSYLITPTLARYRAGGIQGWRTAVRRLVTAILDRDCGTGIKTNATERAGLAETDPRKHSTAKAEMRVMVELAGAREWEWPPMGPWGRRRARLAVEAGVRIVEHDLP